MLGSMADCIQAVRLVERSVVEFAPKSGNPILDAEQTHVAREIVRSLGSIPTVIILSQVSALDTHQSKVIDSTIG